MEKNKEFIVKMTDISWNINSVTIYGTSKGSIINTINDKLNELRDTERFIRIAENNFFNLNNIVSIEVVD